MYLAMEIAKRSSGSKIRVVFLKMVTHVVFDPLFDREKWLGVTAIRPQLVQVGFGEVLVLVTDGMRHIDPFKGAFFDGERPE